MRAVHLILVVPCYNEELRLPVEALRAFRLEGCRLEFCLVDDGSVDGTRRLLESIAAEAPERFFVLGLERNGGKAEAVRLGTLAALERKPDAVGFWDADLATPLEELPTFLEVLRNRPEVDVVMAARVRLLGREISRNPARHYFGRVGATLISMTLGLPVYDTQCGAKLFRSSEGMKEVFGRPFLSRWLFDVEIIARLVAERGRERAAGAICELPITVWRDVKGSKVRSTDFVRALKDLWKIHRAYGLRR